MLCISPAYAVMRCLSVCPAVTFVYSIEMNKHIFKLFSPSGSHTILLFRTKRYGNIPTVTPVTGASCAGGVGTIRDSRRIGGYRSMTAAVRTTATVQRAVYRTQHHVHQWIYVYHNQHGRPRRREENRTKFICTHRYVLSKTCARRIVLLKLLTDTKHRAASLRQQGYFLCNCSVCSNERKQAKNPTWAMNMSSTSRLLL